MAIDRYALVSQHNPVLEAVDVDSPLTVGNGELAFTVDVTGLQTLYREYLDTCPLCTMSQWGWHTKPVSGERYDYTLKDLVMTEFDYNGRKVSYPKESKPGNEEVYEWLRKNPHRLNLARIGLEFEDGEIGADRLSEIHQELDLYSGVIKSRFLLEGEVCQVETACDNRNGASGNGNVMSDDGNGASDNWNGGSDDGNVVSDNGNGASGNGNGASDNENGASGNGNRVHGNVSEQNCDTIAVKVKSSLLKKGTLSIGLSFPYGSHHKSASDFGSPELHSTEILCQNEKYLVLKRMLDRDIYYVTISMGEGVCALVGAWKEDAGNGGKSSGFDAQKEEAGKCGSSSGFGSQVKVEGHKVSFRTEGEMLELCIRFSREAPSETAQNLSVQQVQERSRIYWKDFWEKGGILQLHNSRDARAEELERRIILSMYLLAVNSCGSAPPQETGLTCNSWYGKMHLEMYFWHCAWAPLWGHTELLERSLPWYLEHLEAARENAARNGYEGARWPKMIALEGIDSPSKIAPLLLWQQPHIIFMLELCYRENHSEEFRRKYWPLVKESADFMADIAVYNEEKKCFELVAPVIPVQECHKPEETLNPAFEVSYWKYTLEIAVRWGKELGQEWDAKWEEVGSHMASLTAENGVYLAHEQCPATYTVYNHDHPSMLMSYGVLADERLEPEIMKNTLEKVIECWNYPSLWGWDFAVMAMTAARLNEPEQAIEILLKDTPKNDYVASGNNRQKLRADLPLYLPGNGSLLLAISMMAEGYEGCGRKHPGFPKEWVVEAEGLQKYI